MSTRPLIALVSGLLFGAGLAVSGMADPARVRAFLDLGGHWDPTLAFVIVGAILPMAIAWRSASRRPTPLADVDFDLPATTPVDARLISGAALFGIGWGIAGLCPGPAIADIAIRPAAAGLFVIPMMAGFALHRLVFRPRSAPNPAQRISS